MPASRPSYPIRLLNLNQDVLSEIVAFLSTRDAINFALTSWVIYPIATRHTLTAVRLWNTDRWPLRVSKFCTYVLGDVRGRLCYLRELEVSLGFIQTVRLGNPETRTAARGLVAVLEQARNLRCLTLLPLEPVLELEPQIGTALAAHTGLLELNVFGLAQRSLGVVSNLRSDLKKLSLSLEWHFCDYNAVFSSIKALRSVEILALSKAPGPAAYPAIVPMIETPEYRWPSVRRLFLFIGDLPISAFVRAFPNVRILCIDHHGGSPTGDASLCWPSLDYLQGSPTSLRQWHINCPIHFLCLQTIIGVPHFTPSPRPREETRRAAHMADALIVLRNTSPVALTISVMAYGLPSSFWAEFASRVPKLQFINIELILFRDDQEHETIVLEWMETVSAAFKSLPVVQFEICINSSLKKHPYPSSQDRVGRTHGLAPNLKVAEKCANTIARNTLCQHIAVGFGSRVHSSDQRDHPFRGEFWWWRVSRISGKRTAVPMVAGVGKRMRASVKAPSSTSGDCPSPVDG